MDRNDRHLKQALENVPVAPELGSVVTQAVARGQRRVRRATVMRRTAASFVALFLVLTATVNISPRFADAIGTIPGVGKLVNILQLNKGPAVGGNITDGQQVGPIGVDGETITISFSHENPGATMPWYQATYQQYPYSLVLELSGVRSLFNQGLPSFANSELIADMYRIVTLDDSAYRFVITFTGPVDVEVREVHAPASLQISVAKAEEPQVTGPVYSVRTPSFGFGERVGHVEAMLKDALGWDTDTVRMLADADGVHFVEAAYLPSREAAEALRAELLQSEMIDFELLIEERDPDTLPAFVAP
ncbi:MAG: hypothetical protein ACOX2K_06730 [Bacillota bacterium]